jgi:N-acetylneuraminic acid mutarotase
MLLALPAVVLLATHAAAQNGSATGLVNPDAVVKPDSGASNLDNQVNGPMWTSNAPIPVALGIAQGSTVASADGSTVYHIGGGISGSLIPTNRVFGYSTKGDTWTEVANIPYSPGIRSYGSAVELNGFIYVFGGLDGTNVINTTFIYDIANDTWSQGTNLPAPRFGSAVATDGAAIWVIGGFGGLSLGDETRTVWMYAPATDGFTTGFADMPIALGRIHGAELPDGTVHVFAGGFDGSSHFVYDSGADSWSSAPGMPFGVTDPATVTDGMLIYLAGGGGAVPRPPGHLQIYDPSSSSWSQGPLMPAPGIDNTSGTIANGTFYVTGGYNGASSVPVNYSFPLF